MRISSFPSIALLYSGLVAAVVSPRAATGSLSFDYDQPLATFHYSTSQPGDKNWVAIYNSYYGGPEDEKSVQPSLTWNYAPESEGTVRVDAAKLQPGHYKAFLLQDDGYKWLADPIEFGISKGPVSFLIPELKTHNARQGDEFAYSTNGLVSNAGDSRNQFSKTSGPSWVKVSSSGLLSGTPSSQDKDSSVTVAVKAADGSAAELNVTIPVKRSGSALVNRLKVMSFNLWHGGTQVNGYHKKQIKFLTDVDVDIVGVQESSGGHAIRMAQALGWQYWQDRDVGIISRYPIVEVYSEVEAGGSVRIALDGNETEVIMWNAHLGYTPYGPYDFCFSQMSLDEVMQREAESGRTPQIKEIVAQMKPFIAASDKVPVLLTGDFNAPSHLDWTEENKKAHCGVGSVPWPSSVEPVNAGLIDSYRYIHDNPVEDEGITWSPIYLQNGDRAEPLDRIDYVYHKGRKMTVLDSRTVVVGEPNAEPNHKDNEWTSDHAAVLTTYKIGRRC